MPGTKGLRKLRNSHQLCAEKMWPMGQGRQDERRRAQDSQLLAHPGILVACSISTDVPKVSRLTQVSALCDIAGGHNQSKQQATRTPPNQGGEQPCEQEDLRSSVRIGCTGWGVGPVREEITRGLSLASWMVGSGRNSSLASGQPASPPSGRLAAVLEERGTGNRRPELEQPGRFGRYPCSSNRTARDMGFCTMPPATRPHAGIINPPFSFRCKHTDANPRPELIIEQKTAVLWLQHRAALPRCAMVAKEMLLLRRAQWHLTRVTSNQALDRAVVGNMLIYFAGFFISARFRARDTLSQAGASPNLFAVAPAYQL